MTTSRQISYCQPRRDKTSQSETPSRAEYDDGSDTLADLQRLLDKVTTIEKCINLEADKLKMSITSFQIMMQRLETDIQDIKVRLLRLLKAQEEITKKIKKLNLVIFETTDTEGLKRTDEQSKKRVENLCRLASDMPITVQWATQMEKSLPGMCITRARFFTEEEKNMLLANAAKLSTLGIYMDHDLTESELKKQIQLDEMAEEGKSKGKVTYVQYDTVCIDGVLHTTV